MNVPIYLRRSYAGLLLVVVLLGATTPAMATHGGPEEITLLGYNEQERRVYWVTYFRDESGKLPQLSYIDFSADRPSEPVLDTTWLKGIKPDDRSARSVIFSRINSQKSQLLPLNTDKLDSLVLTARIIERGDYLVANDLSSVARFEMAVTIRTGGLVGVTRVTAYINRRIGVKEWVKIPNEQFGIATISFTGISYESGYLKDTVVLLKP
ncbi:MAG: hypothetical protein MN733_29585 [Nitrososphaera sp.]|nr:hypothetical protein [Nitrososphaera sp.]